MIYPAACSAFWGISRDLPLYDHGFMATVMLQAYFDQADKDFNFILNFSNSFEVPERWWRLSSRDMEQ